jgi:acetyltransferase-like isoleucine patch superfamily enzyme
MSLINKILNRLCWLFKIGYKYILNKSSIRGSKDAKLFIGNNVKIKNSNINVLTGSSLTIGNGTIIQNVNLSIKGNAVIGDNNIITSDNPFYKLDINIDGKLFIGNKNRIQSRILIRYGGDLSINNHNNINQESEIRVDENISIGSFNQISYKVIIWDTNTHNLYPAEHRRKLAEEKFPIFGYEYEKPKTKPVIIGDDCWIGREAVLLKGASLSDKCVLGFRTVLSDCITEKNTTIVTKVSNKVFLNNV